MELSSKGIRKIEMKKEIKSPEKKNVKDEPVESLDSFHKDNLEAYTFSDL